MRNKVISERLILCRGTTPRKKVAQDVGIALTTLQSYENGKRIPRDEIKERLANYYHKTVQELFF